MALFKIFNNANTKNNLPENYKAGYCYFDVNTGKFYIDTIDDNKNGRIPISGEKADKLRTSRTITLNGDVTGSTTFDGSGDVTITAAVAADSHAHDTQYLRRDGNNTMTGNLTFTDNTFCKDILINGAVKQHRLSAYDNAASNAVWIFSSRENGATNWKSLLTISMNGTVSASTFKGALNGNADTATAFKTAQTITVAGDATGTVTFDGSKAQTLSLDVGSADQLSSNYKINGTAFNGSKDITTASWGTARNFTIGSTTKAVNGSAAMSWSYKEIGISKDYSSFATASTNTWGWYTIATIADSTTSPALFLVRAYAHSSLVFTVTKGYSTSGSLNVLDYNASTNQDYASVSGARLLSDGRIQLQLRTKKTTNASQNANVDISINVINSSDTLTLASSLVADDTASPSVIITRSCTTTGAIIASSFVGKASSASTADAVAWANVTGKPSTFSPSSHTHDYLPLSGGYISGNISFTGTTGSTSPTAQRISINGVDNDATVANAPGIGFNIGGLNWGSIKFQSDGSFRFYNNGCTSYMPIYGSAVYGAVWNDYAEYRSQNEPLIAGYITYCDDDGKLKYTTERLQKFEGVVSDTFGFAIGETDECKTPLAVSGRALVYCDPEDHFHSGDCVCAGPDGKAYRMTREEVTMYPDRIVGVVSEIPTYERWGSGNVEVNGRIWIKVH